MCRGENSFYFFFKSRGLAAILGFDVFTLKVFFSKTAQRIVLKLDVQTVQALLDKV